ncbi:hypothetical protein AVEN_269889-1 [Araneus ventricosus]|uniref:Uncharacterized protein n=1 Tax=Araneus ventricosus TaxID=182803 RepID=A0A4Y2IDL7_ARAVE|nr:hypothetical protein AVEN_269889-1 [Araneus ventricosus]
MDALGWTTVKCFYWSDSTTVLTWITKEENWSVFVNNRVQEIRKIGQPSAWRHVSGVENRADLPSRGCKASYLVKTRFWEGPRWSSSFQDKGTSNDFGLDEDEILKERKKSAVSALVSVNQESSTVWFCQRFSKYENMALQTSYVLLSGKKVIKYGTINAIDWKFNPPTAAWWGGWWERLIRIMNDLLKRV